MKKIGKCGLALIGVMLVFALVACGGKEELNDSVSLKGFSAKLGAKTVGTWEMGTAISGGAWNDALNKSDLSDDMGIVDFLSLVTPDDEVSFSAVKPAKGLKVTFAISDGVQLPDPGDFNGKKKAVPAGSAIYFKVRAESGKKTVYYGFSVFGVAVFTDNANITSVSIAGGKSVNPSTAANNTNSIMEKPPTGDGNNYNVPIASSTGSIALSIQKNNALQTVTWVKVAADKTPTDAEIIGEFTPVSGNTVSAVISTSGVADGDKLYIKVISSNAQGPQPPAVPVATKYFAIAIGVGNVAKLKDDIVYFGEEELKPGGRATWGGANDGVLVLDLQDVQPPDGFTLKAEADEQGTIMYATSYAFVRNQTAADALPWTNTVPATVKIERPTFLFFKIVSYNQKTTAYYKVNVLNKAEGTILYGRPDIIDENNMDPLWSDTTWNNEWPFIISRVNTNEMDANFKFLNTVDGDYDDTEYGHTEGKARAYWDDAGLYIYAEMTYHDYYANEAAKTSTTPSARMTVPIARATDNSSAHLYDSLEIFTNERLQQYKQGNNGIQYRVGPARDGGTAITGDTSVPNAIDAFRDSNEYYTWIRRENGKEVGYSVLAHVPWMCQTDTNASQMFNTDGTVKAEKSTGPTIGMELQLNTCTVGGVRDSILTWNGVTGQSYQNVRYYGNVTLVMGDGVRQDKPISNKTIQLPAPLGGMTGATTVSSPQFKGTVTWNPALTSGKFAYTQAYTATVTLTPGAGYTFDSLTSNTSFFNVAGADTVTNTPTGVVTVVFPATLAAWTASGDYDISTTIGLPKQNADAFTGQYGSFSIPLSYANANFELSKYKAVTIEATFYGDDGNAEIAAANGLGQFTFYRGSISIGGDYNLGVTSDNRLFTAMNTALDPSGGNPTSLSIQNSDAEIKFIKVTKIVFHP